jgi:hypothetical protein
MYCSSCGRQVDAGLSYCNGCGARLAGKVDPRALPPANFNTLLGAVIGIPILGIAMIFIYVAALKNGMGLRDDFVFAVIFLTFLLLALAELGCVVMLVTRTKGLKHVDPSSANYPELSMGAARGLGSPTFEPMPVGSVTDRTTRTLDPAVQERSED